MATIIDGKAVAKEVQKEIKAEVEGLVRRWSMAPGLAVVLVGEDPASHIYVRNKEKACKDVGIKSFEHFLPATVSEKELLALVHQLNKDKHVHGILVQLPLPPHIHSERILDAISPHKDVDGFHPVNQGNLVVGADGFRPCTPLGVMKLLEAADCDPKGKNAVVVGRSNIVGKPVALMLLEKHATVTICHSRTASLRDEVARGDIVVVADMPMWIISVRDPRSPVVLARYEHWADVASLAIDGQDLLLVDEPDDMLSGIGVATHVINLVDPAAPELKAKAAARDTSSPSERKLVGTRNVPCSIERIPLRIAAWIPSAPSPLAV